MNKKMERFWSSPILIVFLIFILPPIGLILLGRHPRVSIVAKITTGITVSVFLFLFLFQYQWVVRSPLQENNRKETLHYKLIGVEYPREVLNSLDETIEAKKDHRFVKLSFSVENRGEKSIFYASLIDQPQLLSASDKYMQDLTLSREPFGNLGANKKEEGFLVFVIPEGETVQQFAIADEVFPILP